jgi:hypothetical protein
MDQLWWPYCMASKVTGLKHLWISYYGVLLRILWTWLQWPTVMKNWSTWFHKPCCEWTRRCWTGSGQNWNITGTYAMLQRSAYWALTNPCKITLWCTPLHFMSFIFILKLQSEPWFYKNVIEVCNYPVYSVQHLSDGQNLPDHTLG